MRAAKAITSIALSLLLCFTMGRKWGDIPPIGPFTNPFGGFWQNAEHNGKIKDIDLPVEQLDEEVIVRFDKMRIPHILAQNEHDLYFAQGYITARDRLWQMDFQTRFAAGRLAEVVGEKALELDKYQRRVGMAYGAGKMVEEVAKDPEMTAIMQAYADGVNAYIALLEPKDYPLEFKLLDYKPEKWDLFHSALLLKLMSSTLAAGSDELYLGNIHSQYGNELMDELFGGYPKLEDPIIPSGTPWHFTPLAIPDPPPPTVQKKMAYLPKAMDVGPLANLLLTAPKEEHLGSNNWAVAGSKSTSGLPILANDPHLNMTLPSIWYQVQLISPQVNVAGVSLPGAPCVIIGMNQDVAWGVTNVGSDVLDWYEVRFAGDDKSTYHGPSGEQKTTLKIEEINVRGKGMVKDTVYYTHLGPITYLEGQRPADLGAARNVPENHALKWVAHLPSNDVRTFYLLNRAKHHADYREALRHYTAPAQNFAFADRHGDIAITPNGYLPLKWPGQGKHLLQAEQERDDWHGRIPFEHNPTVKNPSRGFISSANQSPVDASYPYYLDWHFAPYDRGHRINQELARLSGIGVEDMQQLQLDSHSILADNIQDTLMQNLSYLTQPTSTEEEAVKLLAQWNRKYLANAIAATLFDKWYDQLEDAIWGPWFKQGNIPMRYPSRDKTIGLLLGPQQSKWFMRENLKDPASKRELILAAFSAAITALTETYGPIGEKWEWSNVRNTKVGHLAGVAALGSATIHTDGSQKTVNAIGRSAGPSWRMVVALGEQPSLFGIIPGGSSGNPGSPFYDNQLEAWAKGDLPQFLLMTAEDHSSNISYSITLKPTAP